MLVPLGNFCTWSGAWCHCGLPGVWCGHGCGLAGSLSWPGSPVHVQSWRDNLGTCSQGWTQKCQKVSPMANVLFKLLLPRSANIQLERENNSQAQCQRVFHPWVEMEQTVCVSEATITSPWILKHNTVRN